MNPTNPAPPLILIVDDEPVIRESVSVYLQDSGFEVIEANNGKAGLAVFREKKPDLMLLDLRMPVMDGLEVLTVVTRESSDTPVIVISGAGVLQDAVEALRLGAADFITKPIRDMAVLEHTVRITLERSRLRAENTRYREFLEIQVASRTADLARRTEALETANNQLTVEIKERERTENALRQSESRLSEIIGLFEGFIYSVTPDYDIDFMNRQLIDHIGREATGERCHTVLFGFDAPCPGCVQERVFKGETVRAERFNPQNGRWYYTIHSPLWGTDGSVLKSQSILIDITDRKQAEETLRVSEAHLREETLRLKSSLKGTIRFGGIIGKSTAMQTVYEAILKAAESTANVILYGESGTGKELVAATIHNLSSRGGKKFVAINCGAIPENLMESEFFGYKKGAFTGAVLDKPGYLATADGGTLFMDEVGELNPAMQVKLLRAIEGGGYTPIGESEARPTDLRIIAATNRDLKQSVQSGLFRKDFFYRIHIFPIYLPPLRNRKEDIVLLIHHFLQLFSGEGPILSIPDHIIKAMQHYHWPGNVRELQSAIHRYITLKEIDFMDLELASPTPGAASKAPLMTDVPANLPLAAALGEFEKKYIERLLKENRWRRNKVADILDIDRRTLFRKMKTYHLD
ncbi:MAG: sigma 54-interacting transcriptional regulator [Pseudomonadota bacterium]